MTIVSGKNTYFDGVVVSGNRCKDPYTQTLDHFEWYTITKVAHYFEFGNQYQLFSHQKSWLASQRSGLDIQLEALCKDARVPQLHFDILFNGEQVEKDMLQSRLQDVVASQISPLVLEETLGSLCMHRTKYLVHLTELKVVDASRQVVMGEELHNRFSPLVPATRNVRKQLGIARGKEYCFRLAYSRV